MGSTDMTVFANLDLQAVCVTLKLMSVLQTHAEMVVLVRTVKMVLFAIVQKVSMTSSAFLRLMNVAAVPVFMEHAQMTSMGTNVTVSQVGSEQIVTSIRMSVNQIHARTVGSVWTI